MYRGGTSSAVPRLTKKAGGGTPPLRSYIILARKLLYKKKKQQVIRLECFGDPYVTEPTAASGREREAEEGKVTRKQEGLQPVAVFADNFSVRIERSSILACKLLYKKKKQQVIRLTAFGDPYENRTRDTAVKGRCLNRLTNGPYM